jgi:benzoyl-CoA reductase/2-hydroxyglutaryl-CoA dehydratase subunit BcrC/BadD/HgdB
MIRGKPRKFIPRWQRLSEGGFMEEIAIQRLSTARMAGAFAKKMYESARRAAEEKAPVAWCMVNWWEGEAILKALGVTSVYPENFGAACASRRAAAPFLDHCVADGFPSSLCGYARNCLGYARKMAEHGGQIPPDAPVGGMAKPVVLVGSGTACDPRYKWFQALGRYLDAPLWVLELPHPGVPERFLQGVVEHDIQYMVEELRGFIAFLEQRLGRKMDWDKLSELVETQIKTLLLWHEVNELRKAVPCPMDARDFWSCMIPAFYLSTDPESLQFYEKLYEEVKQRVDNHTGVIPNEKYRLMFAELPPWHSLEFFDYFAKYGGVFVAESWGYHPPLPLEILGELSDPVEKIAWITYWWLTGYYDKAMEIGQTAAMVQAYVNWAKDYKCDGAMCHPLLSCRTATFFLVHLRNVLLEQAKVPSLLIQGDIVDLRVFNETQAKMEVDAFIETMDHYKRVREKEGLGW